MRSHLAPVRSSAQPDLRTELHAELLARRSDVEAAVFARIESSTDLTPSGDPNYLDGLRSAVHAAVGYSLAAIATGVERLAPVPPTLLAQARLAAHHGVGIDTVLRRYIAGQTILAGFMVDVASQQELSLVGLQAIEREQAVVLDRVLAAISEEHARASSGRPPGSAQRHADRIRRLLMGEPLDTSDLCYDFGGYHIALVASGPAPLEALRGVAEKLDCLSLFVDNGEAPAWAWLGSSREFGAQEVARITRLRMPTGVALAVGEPGSGTAGWALSHKQAAAALPIAQRAQKAVVRYAEVTVLASLLHDDLATLSLRRLYLEPLGDDRAGDALRQTLCAYFAAERNVSSAAAAIGVSRRTVANRLQVAEKRLGGSMGAIGSHLELALHLDELQALP